MSYVTKSGDTWDGIAKTVYGAERYADYLMQENPMLLDVYRFDAGVELATPALPEEKSGFLPPWKFEG
nr:MAG: baseplate wedge protein [Bacteriophage sp.]